MDPTVATVLAVVMGCLIFTIVIIAVQMFANCIRDPNDNTRHPFWWVFFLGIAGAIIYILLGIRDYTCSTAIRLPAKKAETNPEV